MTTKRPGNWSGGRRAEKLLWGLVLFTLPVTSFRYYPDFFGTTQVKPLAFLPLAPYLLLAGLRILRERRFRWLSNLVPLGVFALIALLSTAHGWLLNPPPLFGITYGHRALRAWLSFAIGLAFLVGALWAYESEADLFWALRWLYAGFLVAAIWGTLQVAAIRGHILPTDTLSRMQRTFSINGLLPRRISGMAYEPSWFAEQLVILYIPWLAAALLSGKRLLRHWWLEALLLVWAGFLLLFTISRSGILVTLVAGASVSLLSLLLWGRQRLSADFLRRAWPRVLGGAAAVALLLAAGFAWLMQINYFAALFHLKPGKTWVGYIVDIYAGPRLAYAWAAASLLERHPWLGVGLGASGFSIYDLLPEWSRTMLPEIARHIAPVHRIFLNPKDMYVRLLAETGLLGFLAFMAFVLHTIGRSLFWWTQSGRAHRLLGIASLWIVVTILLYWFTQDSLTSPQVWLSLGTILALSASPASKENAHEQA